jgi:CRISPR/Cas system CMR subunit Cmr6 (Cas7 group RAMP superfamily)
LGAAETGRYAAFERKDNMEAQVKIPDVILSRQTLLQQMAEQMIREVAKDIYAEWLQEKKETIKKAVLKNLKNENTLVESIAEKLVKGLGASFYVDVRMNIDQS